MIHDPATYLAWAQLNMIVGIICTVVVLICGIGLLWVRDWARRLLVGYGVFAGRRGSDR